MIQSYLSWLVSAIFLPGLLYSAVIPTQAGQKTLHTGDEIAQRINARDVGEAVSRTLKMEMVDRRGKKRVRITRTFRKYYGKEKRMAIFYLSPKNVKDTAFLTIDYQQPDRDDDQWLYLPALRKVRRISASDRGNYFLGTDLTYEDIKKETKVDIDDYKRKTIGEEIVDGRHCLVIEAIPVNEKVAKELGYSRTLHRVDPEIWMIRKAQFWDVRGNPLKTINFRGIRNVQGIWTVHQIEVKNQKTGHNTLFTFSDVDYQSEVKDDLFTKRALKRGL